MPVVALTADTWEPQPGQADAAGAQCNRTLEQWSHLPGGMGACPPVLPELG
jgi:hypothetical protein